MNPKNLTDEQCWKIWCAIEPDSKEQNVPSREKAIDYVRTWLGAGVPIPALEGLALRLWETGADELAVFLEELACARRSRN